MSRATNLIRKIDSIKESMNGSINEAGEKFPSPAKIIAIVNAYGALPGKADEAGTFKYDAERYLTDPCSGYISKFMDALIKMLNTIEFPKKLDLIAQIENAKELYSQDPIPERTASPDHIAFKLRKVFTSVGRSFKSAIKKYYKIYDSVKEEINRIASGRNVTTEIENQCRCAKGLITRDTKPEKKLSLEELETFSINDIKILDVETIRSGKEVHYSTNLFEYDELFTFEYHGVTYQYKEHVNLYRNHGSAIWQ